MKNLMHWFDKAVDTVVTTQHVVSAVDMTGIRVCYLFNSRGRHTSPTRNTLPNEIL